MEKLSELSKKELTVRCRTLLAQCTHSRNVINNKTSQIRCFRLRLKKIRNSIDYLLVHPFSSDSAYNTQPHKRDKK